MFAQLNRLVGGLQQKYQSEQSLTLSSDTKSMLGLGQIKEKWYGISPHYPNQSFWPLHVVHSKGVAFSRLFS